MTRPTRIPSDVNRPDRILGPFTVRQVTILAAAAGGLYLAWLALRPWLAAPVFLLIATPLAALTFAVAVGHRDGLPLDRLLIAAVRHRLTHARPGRVSRGHSGPEEDDDGEGGGAVPNWLAPTRPDASAARGRCRGARRQPGFPARSVATAAGSDDEPGGVGVVDLGPDGLVAIAALSTVNLTLRTPAEQDGLVDTYARYLHTLSAPVQILVRAVPLDLTTHLRHLHAQARALPHPALAAAASAHRDHLVRLAARRGEHELLTRQVLLILREPTRRATTPGATRSATRAAEHRLLRRLGDATTLLAPLEVTVAPLTAAHTTTLLTSITNPDAAPDDLGAGGSPGCATDRRRPVRRRNDDRLPEDHPASRGDRRSTYDTDLDAERDDVADESPGALPGRDSMAGYDDWADDHPADDHPADELADDDHDAAGDDPHPDARGEGRADDWTDEFADDIDLESVNADPTHPIDDDDEGWDPNPWSARPQRHATAGRGNR